PKTLRDRHHLNEGETVVILDSGEGVEIRHGRSSLRGLLKGRIDAGGFEKDLKQMRKEWTL
ncbi:MAG: hypothetical protein ACREEC_14330, partial [Thermoplasmata archaeon]